MRLLHRNSAGRFYLTKDLDDNSLPEYAILSHTWGRDEDEVTFEDISEGTGEGKPGYEKLRFCGEQADRDGLQYFWVDTCCINKTVGAELTRSIHSMFSWYRKARRCYVYLSDVPSPQASSAHDGQVHWEQDFRKSRWFTRGWTLQELLAPESVEFFSCEGTKLSDKSSLGPLICEITNIPLSALQGEELFQFSFQERLRWVQHRRTKLEEDAAYSLLGIFDIYIFPSYGEGTANALARLKDEFDKVQKCVQELHLTDPSEDKKRIEHTKGGLLKGSYNWVLENPDFQQWLDAKQSRLLWIKGDPGKGKTMLLCGIINELKRSMAKSDLLSYFFFQETDSRINNPTGLLRGLIYMLVIQQPSLVSHIQEKYDQRGKSLFEDVNAWFALSEIFTSILRDPSRSTTTYLIIDALDECASDLPKLLDFIVRNSADSPRVKWIISSRNWPDIGEWLVNAGQNLSLELNVESVSAAVSTFTQHKVLELAQRKKYNNKIRDAVYDHLSANSNGTFLWVALVCQDLENIPKIAVLRKLNEFPPGLDALYKRMMNKIRISGNADLYNRILATIALVYRPITLPELTSLIDVPRDTFDDLESLQEIIGFCGSFLTIRAGAIFFVHQSAKDFLFAKVFGEIFPHGKEGAHHDIFLKSLEIMSKTLKRDIYSLRYPGTNITQVKTPEPDPLEAARYSCLFWVDHLTDCHIGGNKISSPEDIGAIYKALKDYFLYWLEALSLMDSLPTGVHMIIKLENLQFIGSPELSAFVHDAKRFALYNRSVIEDAPLQAYCSALIFSPKKSIVRENFENCIPSWFQRKPKVQDHWSAALQTLEGYQYSVESVAFSPDGKQVVSGSYDGTVRLWDAITGATLHVIEQYSGCVNSVDFSSDGKLIASGASDNTIRLWDTGTGAEIQILKGHSADVMSVAFSPDNKQVVSGSSDTTVGFWDAATGAILQVLIGHSRVVWSVSISSDSKLIASGSSDNTIRLWDAATAATLRILESNSGGVNAVAFSPDNSQIVSGSDYCLIQLWDAATGAMLRKLSGHSGPVSSIAFSLDGKQVVSGSSDHTVRLWEAIGAPPLTLKGHNDGITSLAFSPDSKQVVSGSEDCTLRLWDVTSAALQAPEGHSAGVSLIVFSPDGTRVISGYVDGMLRLWDATGTAIQTFEGHSSHIRSIAFSPDGEQILSGDSDGLLQLWNTTGANLQTFQCSSKYFYETAFSLSNQIICWSFERTVCIWDAETGVLLEKFEDHQSRSVPQFPPWQGDNPPTTLDVHHEWIESDFSNILWLPHDYRAECQAFWGESAVLGHASGKISFFKFSPGPKLIL